MTNKKNKITEVTRRNVADAFSSERINWSGRFEEHEFLGRLYDLSAMPSTDPRDRPESDAAGDIYRHCTLNPHDWEDGWVFTDSRFALLEAPDGEFLSFLCEVMHPLVQSDPKEVQRILGICNEHLKADGWILAEQMSISGRPVYAGVPSLEIDGHIQLATKVVAESISSDYVIRQITRMQSAMHDDPDLAIGQAKEFVETICKTVLKKRNVSFGKRLEFPKLVRLTMKSMKLVDDSVTDAGKSTNAVKLLLSNLSTVSDSVVQLRNLHATGHGKEAESKGLTLRHARLAVGAATTLGVFLWESHMEDRK